MMAQTMQQHAYGSSVIFAGDMQAAEEAVTAALKESGFGVLTRIDVAATLKNKLGVERRPYVILGACNPQKAHLALQAEEEVGLLLPCNVIVYKNAKDETVISAIDAHAMLGVIQRDDIASLADEVNRLLQEALARAQQLA